MAERLGVGIIGLHEGKSFLKALTHSVPDSVSHGHLLSSGEPGRSEKCFAVGGFDIDHSKRQVAQDLAPGLFYPESLDEFLAHPELDIVAIYTPDSTHADLIVRAFQAGKHVICTKPFVNDLSQIAAVLDAQRGSGKRLMVGQSTRFFEPFAQQRRRAENGEFGDIEFVDAQYCHRMDWFYDKSPWAITDTDWIFLGMSHPLDMLRWYLGPIKTVQAIGTISALGREVGLKTPDVYSVQVHSQDGRIGRAFGHYGLIELPSARNAIELMLYGSKGTSLAQYHDMRLKRTGEGGHEITEDWLYLERGYYFNNEVHGMHYGEFARLADTFARAILKEEPTSPELHEGIDVVLLMEAARRSARDNRPVEIAELRSEIGL
ncbi:MAG: Gfo/Idh/MocA family oxidoreductase [Armatimonadetes bacterium]|nr:Gfo/Idh/MocA family oxidoreductase [Armatimonadota bacterium]